MQTAALRNVPQLRPDQARIAAALSEYDVIVAAMGRRWGKTVFGLVLVLAALLNGMRVAWVVPTYRNSNPLWRALRGSLVPLLIAKRARINQAERYVELWNGGFLGIYSADNADAIRGEWFHLVVVDEAARVAEEVMSDVIAPTVADVGGKIVNLSTPKGRNWFWREYQRGVERVDNVIAFQAPSSANPNPRIQRAARLAALKFGEDSDTVRQEWGAEFVDSGAVIWLREWCQRYSLDDEVMDRKVIARMLTYDTANKDKDTNAYTACAVIELLADYRARLRHVWRERLLMPRLVARVQGDELTSGDIARWNHDGKLTHVVIEDRASGTGLYQTMHEAGSPELKSMLVPFNPTGSKDERFGQAGIWVKNGSFLIPQPSDQARWLHAWEAEIFEEDEFKDQRDATAQGILYWEHLLAEGHRARMGYAA
jgi:phage terminase large subunit-like protein